MRVGYVGVGSGSRHALRASHLVLTLVVYGGCAQLGGFDVGAPLVLSNRPDASVSPPGAPPPAAALPDAGAACAEYCQLQQTNCAGPLSNYYFALDADECVALCRHFPAGAAQGNTLDCRLASVRSAAASLEPSEDCAASSRTGSVSHQTQCGTTCEAYCSLVLSVCKDEAARVFTDASDCASKCLALRDDGRVVDPRPCLEGGADEKGGATVQCRLWHVGAAARSLSLGRGDSSTHCGHALGAAPCAEPARPPPACQ